MIWLLKEKTCFYNVFMTIRLKCFYDSLYIVVILAFTVEFFSANSAKFPLTFTE